MFKSSSTKFMRLLGLLLSLTLLCFTYACSNDAESVESGTAAGGAAYGVHIKSFTGAADAAYSGQSVILTAYVTDSSDNPVRNAEVTFHFTSNTSGASLKSLGGQTGERIKATTDKGGLAQVVYNAGENSIAMELSDVIAATCHDSKMAFMITRVAGGSQGLIISVTADQDSLKAGENTIIKAKVTNATGVVIGGQAVTFTIAENNSGATLRTLGTGVTDASGEASAVYKAGATSPAKSIQDTVQAAVPDAAGAVFITRLANTAIIGCRLTLTADKTSLEGGKNTILRATVLNGDGKPYIGNIKFEFLTNSSEGTLSPSSAQTNSNGVATTVYKAGTKDSGVVEDIIKASATQCCTGNDCCAETLCCSDAGCCSETIIITRSGQPAVTPTGYRIAVTAEKISLTAGETTLVTATVTTGSGSPAQGQTVSFSFAASPSGGALSTISGTTDASGRAVASYTAGSDNPTLTVQDIIQAGTTGATGAVILTRTAGGSSQGGLVLTLTANPSAATPGNTSVLTARVVNGDNQPVTGLAVTFEFLANNGGSSLNPLTGTTDGSGNAVSVYTAGTTASSETRYDTVRASVTGASGVVIITRAPNPGPENKVLTLAQNPATSPDNRVVYSDSSTVLITATVTRNGLAWPQEPITFSIVSGLGNIVSAASETDANGRAEATFELPTGLATPVMGTTVIAATIAGEGGSPITVHTPVYWAIWYYGP
ncbi:MAG: hypothetical protein QUS13_13410 [Smithella sp.]|nr:hypothetical protein [Smithella sp.]